jgi:hypothetical protein
MEPIIDYSAWREWTVCPAGWYEKYVNKRIVRWPPRDRDDALCLGALVHAGLQQWQEQKQVIIPPQVVEEMTPSRETLVLAEELVYGYTQVYPEELWPLIVCEEPLVFPLTKPDYSWACLECGAWGEDYGNTSCPNCCHRITEVGNPIGWQGLAKVDAYFYVNEPCVVESGQPGLQFTLSEGWWIHEYKTKSPYISLPLFLQKWEMNMQASFQMLALQNEIDKGERALVQGVLVSVIEKPRKYIPKRKCKTCQESYEYATWIPTGDGRFSCPVCGVRQELAKLKENPSCQPPAYYRIMVTRTQEQLEKAKQDMVLVGQRMAQMEANGLASEPWHTESCIQYKRPCGYFGNHLYGLSTLEDPKMENAREYRGLAVEGEEV